ncbi:MAG: hypothetical protein R3F43_21710 [bacterium]
MPTSDIALILDVAAAWFDGEPGQLAATIPRRRASRSSSSS